MPFLDKLLRTLSALLSCVSPSSPAPLAAAGVTCLWQKQPPCLLFLLGLLHLREVPLPLLGSLQQDTSSPSNVSSAHTFPFPPQAAVNIKISMCHKVRYVSLHFSSLWKSRRKQKRRKKQSRNKRGVSRWGLKRDRKSIRQCVWAPHRGLKITWDSCFLVFFLLPPTLSSETSH